MKWSSRHYLIAFNMVSGIGGRRLQNLQSHFKSLERAWNARGNELRRVQGIGPQIAERLVAQRSSICPHNEEAWAKNLGAKITTWADEHYPAPLRRLPVPPPVLYVLGNIPVETSIAIVGTRKPSRVGIAQTRHFSAHLVKHKKVIVSGLARGIDYFAHEQALRNQGKTVAVLGSNLKQIYPAEHRGLVQQIRQSGAVISEFSSRCPTVPGNFPRRNRIIAGLSQGVLVIQAGQRSGALNTADWALDLGLDIWAIPGEISDPLRIGTNNLIKQGAHLVTTPEDLTDFATAMNPTNPSLGDLHSAGLHPNEIAATLKLPIEKVLAQISELQVEMGQSSAFKGDRLA